ncbi:hypothetical protein GCK32_004854 [Trichostrongylus colubriformis]|uniref:PABS domain-containing protein n=1 Tax=Trichostrongylus colubriformis TaxID=6319 RepID=A0AAN8F4A1_TRICO
MLTRSVWLCTIAVTNLLILVYGSDSYKHASSSFACSNHHYGHSKYNKLVNQFTRIYGYERVLEESICLSEGQCIRLSDYVDDNEGFVRVLKTDFLLISAMHLKIPEKEMFTSGAIEIKKDVKAQVLVIGLGAGFINSYLHHTYPEMQITVVEIDAKMLEVAKKWFDLVLDNRHTVTIMDGIDFLKQALSKGIRYNAILIDACTLKDNVATNCPVKVFYEKENLDILSKLITNKARTLRLVVVKIAIILIQMRRKILIHLCALHLAVRQSPGNQCDYRTPPMAWPIQAGIPRFLTAFNLSAHLANSSSRYAEATSAGKLAVKATSSCISTARRMVRLSFSKSQRMPSRLAPDGLMARSREAVRELTYVELQRNSLSELECELLTLQINQRQLCGTGDFRGGMTTKRDKRVVIVNVLNIHGRPYTAAKKVETAFEEVFKQCTAHISEFSPLNTILTCSHFERSENLLRKYMKFANYTISVS